MTKKKSQISFGRKEELSCESPIKILDEQTKIPDEARKIREVTEHIERRAAESALTKRCRERVEPPADLFSKQPLFTAQPSTPSIQFISQRLRTLEEAVFGDGNDSVLEGKAEMFLQKFTPGIEWVKQHPVGLYRADFALPSICFAVEIDGHAYHSSAEQIQRDKKRDRDFLMMGWRVMRFHGSEFKGESFDALRAVADYLNAQGVMTAF